MLIYVVRAGDTVYSISTDFNVSMADIATYNRLHDVPGIIPGQAIIIPSYETTYIVEPGDSLWSISEQFQIPVSTITRYNNLAAPYIVYPGMEIIIPSNPQYYGELEVNAYITPSSLERDQVILEEVGDQLTYLSPLNHIIREDGQIILIEDQHLLDLAEDHQIQPLMVVTNLRDGEYDSALIHTVLRNPVSMQNLIDNIYDQMVSGGYYGLNLDIERIPAEDEDLFYNFVEELVYRLSEQNYPLITSLVPRTATSLQDPRYAAPNYEILGELSDAVILMTYEWGWARSHPLPVAPIDEVRAVLDYAITKIPPSKIMLGIPLYGYDWKLPFDPAVDYAVRVSPQMALSLAVKYNATIRYNEQVQAPYFYYTDENGIEHIVWFEDPRSIKAKLDMVNEYDLQGVSYWQLGYPFPQNWYLLDSLFNIRKID